MTDPATLSIQPVTRNQGEFCEWSALLNLLQTSFAYMNARIDPPSSLRLLNLATIQKKAETETLFYKKDQGQLVGCAFMDDRGDHYYLGKVATNPDLQSRGLGSEILMACIEYAKTNRKSFIELQSRVELIEVHRFFEKRGFVKCGDSAHEGYDRPTSFTFQLDL